MKTLFVGNLPYSTTEDQLRAAFTQYGAVTRAELVTDRSTGISRGFGFVGMDNGAEAAIEAMDGQQFQGRRLTVNKARPRAYRHDG